MRVVLIGMRRAGKTTVGRLLAEGWSVPFVDTDDEIRKQTGRSCSDILARDGEEAFRRVEKTVVRQTLAAVLRGVVATGGGVPEDLESAGRLKSFGIVIYLQADLGTLLRRLQADPMPSSRPVLGTGSAEDEITRTWLRRDPLYRRIARHVIRVDGTPRDVAARVRVVIEAGLVSSENSEDLPADGTDEVVVDPGPDGVVS